MKKLLIVLFTLLIIANVFAEVKLNDSLYVLKHGIYEYQKPKPLDFMKNIPSDFVDFYHQSFSLSNWKGLSLISLSTGALIYYDEPIIDETRRIGKKLNISAETNNAVGFPFLEFPADFGTALYFIGDGAVDITLAASFLTFGLITDDNRALQTASQITEGMITSGLITVQILKHTSGRISPRANNFEDKWRPFPNQIEYHKNVSHYDAYPSGHLTTSMMTYIVIRENYPEYKFIDPLAWTLMTALSFEMVNNGVHWAGDYPLAIGLGYVFGKIAVSKGRTLVGEAKTVKDWKDNVSVIPFYKGDLGLNITANF